MNLRPYIEKKSTEVERQVALTLYFLEDEGRIRKTANAFGLAISTVSVIIRRVTFMLTTRLGPKYIKLPRTEAEVQDRVKNFYKCYGIHVEIKDYSTLS